MNSHQLRFLTIAFLTLVVIIAEVVLMARGMFGTTESAVLGGSLAILLPAFLDARAVEQRRRNPKERAIDDDTDSKS